MNSLPFSIVKSCWTIWLLISSDSDGKTIQIRSPIIKVVIATGVILSDNIAYLLQQHIFWVTCPIRSLYIPYGFNIIKMLTVAIYFRFSSSMLIFKS